MDCGGQSYITVNGGTNGVIRNTANGDALANKVVSSGIGSSGAFCANFTVQNLTISNIYIKTHIGRQLGGFTVFDALDAAYLATPGNPAGSTVYLAIEADRDDDTFAAFYYPLNGNGAFQTITSSTGGTALGGSTGTLTSGNVEDLFVFSYFCNGTTGSCGAFRTNLGQFALDNIALDVVSAVPEPSGLGLVLTALAACGAVSRRRRTV